MALLVTVLALLPAAYASHAPRVLQPRNASPSVAVDWNNVVIKSKTTMTLQSVANPLLLANSSIDDNALASLSLVAADYVRYVPWFPYPELAVPELEPPVITDTSCTTSWNFSYADQILGGFLNSTQGKKHIINFSTTPDWMWVTDTPYSYPTDVNTIDWSYNNGTQLRDSTFKEVGDYYARIVSWYTKGGFTDECGTYHHSGYAWPIEFWEVLNEVDLEHEFTPGYYNQVYDAITSAISAVNPAIEFVGLALSIRNVTWVQSFLNASNHAPGTPLDWISYHFYAIPTGGAPEASQAAQSFQQADEFFAEVRQIEAARKALAPDSHTTLDEIGTIDTLAAINVTPGYTSPPEYYVWSGGVFAYVFANVATMGIDVLGESQLVGYPGQFPSVSMVNWTTGEPNARLRVLQLLQTSFAQGDALLNTTSSDESTFHAQAFAAAGNSSHRKGKRLLLINKGNETLSISVPGFDCAHVAMVDVSTGGGPWSNSTMFGEVVELAPYAVAVLTAQ